MKHSTTQDKRALFISDLHLSDETPKTLAAFELWLRQNANATTDIYILGDFFEYWVGDDHLTKTAQAVQHACRQAGTTGANLYFMHGNRDFLIGPAFLDASGLTALPDPFLTEIHGITVSISHGDLLCTDDVAYQQFRKLSRNAQWQAAFLSKPLAERIAYAESLRKESRMKKSTTAADIMDVNLLAVENAFAGHWPLSEAVKSDNMIHGHTHRNACHRYAYNGEQQHRWVLSDWEFDHGGQARGNALSITARAWEFIPVSRPPIC
ncbi:MAG: UDP-2,3-diacylglucosamine diphosphatase [Burkholderiales bacterium]|jgi:UDP-2,3-diacylglucosamine hydrolase|nr:UDP-2,3-diacylglucosamine diphosphatase [Burkholderiales bacterium]